MPDYIKRRRKKKAHAMRKGMKNDLPDGDVENMKMQYGLDEEESARRGKDVYTANPSINFNKEGKVVPQNYEQAKELGEVFEFKKKIRAKKFAAGSWKKGKDRKESMALYRELQKIDRKEKND